MNAGSGSMVFWGCATIVLAFVLAAAMYDGPPLLAAVVGVMFGMSFTCWLSTTAYGRRR